MKVRIEADGRPRGTRVLDEHGNPVEGVTEVLFRHQASGAPEITVGIILGPAVIEGEAKVYGANGKIVSKVIYADGTETDYS